VGEQFFWSFRTRRLSRQETPPPSPWQSAAVQELRELKKSFPGEFKLRGRPKTISGVWMRVAIQLATGDLEQHPDGLPLQGREDFVLWIGRSDLLPPLVEVEHDRFVGFPHVLHGRRLCIYLDPGREWDPRQGMTSAINRLHAWLADAAAGRFDPRTSLFHAVGGVLYGSSGLPTVVVRDFASPKLIGSAFLTRRTDHRLDLHPVRADAEQLQAPVVAMPTSLPLGVGHTLAEVVTCISRSLSKHSSDADRPDEQQFSPFTTALAACASRMPHDSPQIFVLAVPHSAGGPPHLLAGRVPAKTANQLRRQVRERKSHFIDIALGSLDLDMTMEWCPVSDEREAVTNRRDADRPVSSFQGKHVHVWGCGGLGSWIAEFVARAGAARITLCDPGTVSGGLLVRQNYTESDVGSNKAEALRDRLRLIRDDIEIDCQPDAIPDHLPESLKDADVVIDATISLVIGQLLDRLGAGVSMPTMAQVATDVRTGTLGIITISPAAGPLRLNEMDRGIGEMVTADGSLEAFHTFWTDVAPEDELIPTLGCSVPTFHGSAADMAAVAAVLTSLLGSHLSTGAPVPGTHLIALHNSPIGSFHRFIAPGPSPAAPPAAPQTS
jgi:hypothetical protein